MVLTQAQCVLRLDSSTCMERMIPAVEAVSILGGVVYVVVFDVINQSANGNFGQCIEPSS